MRYHARYLDGRSARVQFVEIEIYDTVINIHRTGNSVTRPLAWSVEEIELTQFPHNGQPARFGRIGTTERLIIDDTATFGLIETRAPAATQSRRPRRAGNLKIMLWSGIAVTSVALFILVFIPLASRQLAEITPNHIKVEIGLTGLDQAAQLFSFMRSEQVGFCVDPAGLNALARLTDYVVADGMGPLRLFVLDTDMANAFALPGHVIAVTRGLISDAESDSEIAGVLAHELGHAAHDHPTSLLYRSTSLTLLTTVLLGDVGLLGSFADHLLQTSYSRDDERTADAYALARLREAGISTKGLQQFFARHSENSDSERGSTLSFLSTHPPTEERLANIHRSGHAGVDNVLSFRDRRDLRNVCRQVQRKRPRSNPQ